MLLILDNIFQVKDNIGGEVEENPIVTTTVLSAYVIFFFAFVMARMKDNKDKNAVRSIYEQD